MSRHAVVSLILIVCVGALALAARYPDVKKELALAMNEKRAPVLRYTEKLRGPLEASLELMSAMPEKQGDVFVIKGVVRSASDLQNADFKWAVPGKVELVNGSVSGQISFLKAGEPVELQLTLKSLEAANHQIHLIVSGGEGTTRFAASAQYNTLLQQVLADSKEALLKSTEKEAQKASVRKKNLKVMH